jgi:hypothetical protein
MNDALFIESGGANISKYGEILCGDSLSVAGMGGGKLMVLSDGLGSGVKANILATLTTKDCYALDGARPSSRRGMHTHDTLPECKVRR